MKNKEIAKETVGLKSIKDLKEVSTIYSTKDYDIFSLIETNRPINQRIYAKIYSSMQDKYLVSPILVNEKFQILDGQHRFTAAKALGFPIYFYVVENYGTDEMKRANQASSNWVKQNFLDSYALDGDERYLELSRICSEHNISIGTVLKVLSKMQNKSQKYLALDFEKGEISIDRLDKVELFLTCLEDFSEFAPYKTIQFFTAFLNLYCRPNYDHERMVSKLESRKSVLVKKNTIDDYLVILTRGIYNYGKVKKFINYDPTNKKFY